MKELTLKTPVVIITTRDSNICMTKKPFWIPKSHFLSCPWRCRYGRDLN